MRSTIPDYRNMTVTEAQAYMNSLTDVREGVLLASSPYLDTGGLGDAEAFLDLIDWESGHIHSALVRRRDRLGTAAARVFQDSKDADVLMGIAENPWARPDVLSHLVQHGNPTVAEMAARNSSCPQDAANQWFIDRYSNQY